MTYEATLDYLFSQLPIYQRVGQAAYKADLSNTHALCEILDHPENGFRSIHIAGTNGKGSTSHIIASVLQEAGYKTGLYTSPHLKDFRERIRINGQMIAKDYVVDFVQRYRSQFEPIGASFFEMTVGMAFRYFTDEKVDIAVIETGLGGRLDSTNVITPEVSVITNIGLDHTHLLGDTIEKIAREKAGIMKPGVPVVIGETTEKTRPIFQGWPNRGELTLAETKKVPSYPTDLLGDYQKINLRTAYTAIEALRDGGWKIGEDDIKKGFANVSKNTGLQGRWQVIGSNPLTICDVGHNEHGLTPVLKQIEATPHQKLHFVLGMVSDKNVGETLGLLPKNAIYYFCQANIPRALSVENLAEEAAKVGLSGRVIRDVKSALETAQSAATAEDLVFVGGSTFVVAEALP